MCNSSLEDLFLLVKESNEDAFDELYHRTWKKLYEIALRRLQHENTAKEVIQDLYIDLWEKRHRKTIQDVDHYLCQAVRFKVIDRFRKEKRYFEELETMVEELSDGSTADGSCNGQKRSYWICLLFYPLNIVPLRNMVERRLLCIWQSELVFYYLRQAH
ncbi:RNA polymerase sigma factor [Sphingobacterium siyangense]|uniref:RNA polymerase sigma factor n=1 Tax=Sphingobacterium siyangense TaxID=459529 RepID=UPI0031F9E5A5